MELIGERTGPNGADSYRLLAEQASIFGRLTELQLEVFTTASAVAMSTGTDVHLPVDPDAFQEDEQWNRLAPLLKVQDAPARLVAQISESAMRTSPRLTLRVVRRLREAGTRIAIVDVGASSDSLSMIRVVKPDLVSIDVGLLLDRSGSHATSVSCVAAAQVEQGGTTIVASGVVNRRTYDVASMFGPERYASSSPTVVKAQRMSPSGPPDTASFNGAAPNGAASKVVPASAASAALRTRGRTAGLEPLLAISRHIEGEANSPDCVLLASMQHRDRFTAKTERQYRALARRCGFVGVLAAGWTPGVRDGVRLAWMDPEDPMTRTWNVVLLSGNASVALVAEERFDGADVGRARLFRYALLTDPAAVEAVAEELLDYF